MIRGASTISGRAIQAARTFMRMAVLIPALALSSACQDQGPTAPQIENPSSTAALSSQGVIVSNIQAASGYSYLPVTGGLANGARAYIDRTWKYQNVPTALQGQTYIRTRMGDMNVAGDVSFLSFDIDRESEVYLVYHGTNLPGWATYRGFSPTGDTLVIAKNVDRQTFHLFSQTYPAGTVTLGSNLDLDRNPAEMYTVIVRPVGTVTTTTTTTTTTTGFDAVVAGIRPRGFNQGTYTRVQPATGGVAYYVSTTGSDSNPGTSIAPFRTINRAAQVAKAGDVVTIRDGTYPGSVSVRNAGTRAKPIVFQAANRGGVVLTGGSHHFVPGNWTGGVQQSGAVWVTLRGLIFQDYAPTQDPDGSEPNARYRAAVGAIKGWKIEDCLFAAAGYSGLDIRGDSVEVERSTFRYHHTLAMAAVGESGGLWGIRIADVLMHDNNTRSDALYGKVATKVVKFWKTNQAVIDNVESYQNQGSGWWFDTDNRNYTIQNSYFHDNVGESGRGVFLEKNRGGGRVENNVFAGNSVAGLVVRNSANVVLTGNIFVGDSRAILLVSQDVEGTWPLQNVTITANAFKGWTRAAGIHTAGNQIRARTAAQRDIVADGNVYDPGLEDELTYWSYTGFIRTMTDMRNKLGWEKNGRMGTVSDPTQ